MRGSAGGDSQIRAAIRVGARRGAAVRLDRAGEGMTGQGGWSRWVWEFAKCVCNKAGRRLEERGRGGRAVRSHARGPTGQGRGRPVCLSTLHPLVSWRGTED
jgi:hypothetical protein